MSERKHILIVDDEAVIREVLSEALSGAGHQVRQADSVSAARRLVAESPPDLLITDLQLGQSDGLVLIAEIKASHPGIPTLLLTGILFDERAIEQRISQKVSLYLPKTTPLRLILSEVQRLLAISGDRMGSGPG